MSCSSVKNVYSLAFVTVSSEEIAKKIAHGLVQNQLAACVNIIPGVKSVFMWEGKVNEADELILKIKTKPDLVDKITEFVTKNQPYDVCEVISVLIDNGNPPYLDWISKTLDKKSE